MPRASRLAALAGLTTILCLVLYASILYTPDQSSTVPTKSKEAEARVKGTRLYFSWFPHGGFPEQHEAFRTAIRIAYETKRTIIAPMLRLGRSYDWAPFDTLARRYEAQDKATLRQLCQSPDHKRHWQTILEPCETINEWTEIPWSVLFDFTELEQRYGIQIIERNEGHGWGTKESVLGGNVDPADVIVVDPMSFPRNGSLTDENAAVASTLPLQRLMRTSQIQQIQEPLIQFGSLASAARYPTGESKGLSALNKDISSRLFILPDRLTPLKIAAEKITKGLGGREAYNWLYLNLTYFNELDKLDPVPINEMSKQDSKDLMAAVVTEIFGDMPINQAVAASMSADEQSRLSNIFGNHNNRKELLATCIDYHLKTDKKYPIYYFINELEPNPLRRPELFEPLFETLPCLFTKQDMYDIGILERSWVQESEVLSDPNVDYEALLSPMLDILVASQAYSFFETPQTLLSRFLNFVLRASQ